MILESPQLKPMLDSNPALRTMFSNPTFLQSLMNPQNLQNMMTMMNLGQNSSGSLLQNNQFIQPTSQPNTSEPNPSSNQGQSTNPSGTSTNNQFQFPNFNPFLMNPLMFGNISSIFIFI